MENRPRFVIRVFARARVPRPVSDRGLFSYPRRNIGWILGQHDRTIAGYVFDVFRGAALGEGAHRIAIVGEWRENKDGTEGKLVSIDAVTTIQWTAMQKL